MGSVAPCEQANATNCSATSAATQPVQPLVDVQEENGTFLGWYYYGNEPPIDRVAFWERVGADKRFCISRTNAVSDELASAVARAQNLCDDQKARLAERHDTNFDTID